MVPNWDAHLDSVQSQRFDPKPWVSCMKGFNIFFANPDQRIGLNEQSLDFSNKFLWSSCPLSMAKCTKE